jgi:hypothetical protein
MRQKSHVGRTLHLKSNDKLSGETKEYSHSSTVLMGTPKSYAAPAMWQVPDDYQLLSTIYDYQLYNYYQTDM